MKKIYNLVLNDIKQHRTCSNLWKSFPTPIYFGYLWKPYWYQESFLSLAKLHFMKKRRLYGNSCRWYFQMQFHWYDVMDYCQYLWNHMIKTWMWNAHRYRCTCLERSMTAGARLYIAYISLISAQQAIEWLSNLSIHWLHGTVLWWYTKIRQSREPKMCRSHVWEFRCLGMHIAFHSWSAACWTLNNLG